MSKKNRLWGCITTPARLSRIAKTQEHFYAKPEYCLVIAKERPKGMTEMTEEFLRVLKPDDWEWLHSQSKLLAEEEIDEHYEEYQNYQKAFLERFEAALEARKGEIADG